MILLINTASTFKGGSVQVAKSFIEECIGANENIYHVILGELLSKSLNIRKFPANFFFYEIGYRPATRVLTLKSQNKDLIEIEKKVKPDVVFTTSGPAYWRPKAPHLIGFNLGHHIYPESKFYLSLNCLKRAQWALKKQIARYFFINDADEYVVQTDDVKNRLKKWLKKDAVHTVFNSCSSYFYKPYTYPPKLPMKESGEFRMLTLSAWYPHKNINIVKDILDNLSSMERLQIKFVLTLPDSIFQKHFPKQYHKNIINVGPIRLEEAPSLYKECDAMFLPTLIECFSASYVEAMSMEKPILTSDLDFAHSICGKAACYFDPLDAKDISKKIKAIQKSPTEQKRLIELGKIRLKRFTNANQRAWAYLSICKNMIDQRQS